MPNNYKLNFVEEIEKMVGKIDFFLTVDIKAIDKYPKYYPKEKISNLVLFIVKKFMLIEAIPCERRDINRELALQGYLKRIYQLNHITNDFNNNKKENLSVIIEDFNKIKSSMEIYIKELMG